jgi:transcription termination factor Rho
VLSSTRRDDLLHDQTTLNRMWIIRKFIAEMNPVEAMNTIRDRLVNTHDNEEFLMSMNG